MKNTLIEPDVYKRQEPLLGYLDAGTILHRLLHVIARTVGKEAVYPHDEFVPRLFLELRLAVERPAHQPRRILDGDDAARHHLSCKRVPLAYPLDIGRNPSVERGQRGRHEIRFLDVAAELLRLAERRVLYGNIRPEAPTSAQRRDVYKRQIRSTVRASSCFISKASTIRRSSCVTPRR